MANGPSDDKFLECADAARADYLITGDLRHFPRFWKSEGSYGAGVYWDCCARIRAGKVVRRIKGFHAL